MRMGSLYTLCLCLAALALASCGYRLGGLKNGAMKDMETFCIDMFENRTVYPQISRQVTTALGDAVQRDGTFRMAPSSSADFCISGVVSRIGASSLRTNPDDSYLSSEVGLTIEVEYAITNQRTGKIIKKGRVHAEGSYFNDVGNIQSARDAALSYAARKAAEDVVEQLTLP